MEKEMHKTRQALIIGINSRFRLAPTQTGVQIWSSNMVDELKTLNDLIVKELVPHKLFGNGIRGHFWEQFILPMRMRKIDILLSPANSGPVLIKRQLICIHDAMVFTNPEMFSITYRSISKILLKSFSLRNLHLLTVSQNSALEIRKFVSRDIRVTVVGMGIPKLDFKKHTKFANSYFLFIGGHIRRKNLEFLIPIWPKIFAETGFKMFVTTNSPTASLMRLQLPKVEGVEYIIKPSNSQMAHLYEGTRALLWPSLAEGFGIPLLEAMSFGKPFISTNVGAARELQTGDSRILSLDRALWEDSIIRMTTQPASDSDEQKKKSENYSWKQVALQVKEEILFLSSKFL